MKIDTWMKRPVVTVRPRDTAAHAREVMEHHRINQLPVLVDGVVVGIVTDRDLRDAFPSVFATAAGDARGGVETDSPTTVTVEELMARRVLTLPPSASMADAARLMRRERIGAVPVVDRGRPVGIVTRSDVLDAFVAMTEAHGNGAR